MKIYFNKTNKETVITTNTYGAVTKEGYVLDTATNKRRAVELYTLIKIIGFDFGTKKIIIECVKGMEQFQAEADLDFLIEHCDLTTPDKNQEVKAIMIQHVSHNMLDKDTAIFIIVMVLTYLTGLVLGKGF